jgi:hypothetical protein
MNRSWMLFWWDKVRIKDIGVDDGGGREGAGSRLVIADCSLPCSWPERSLLGRALDEALQAACPRFSFTKRHTCWDNVATIYLREPNSAVGESAM